jgi:hypothetical protein
LWLSEAIKDNDVFPQVFKAFGRWVQEDDLPQRELGTTIVLGLLQTPSAVRDIE